MKFIHRLAYYLGGFAIGLMLLMFFLNGKDASCDYGPNARTIKNIGSKSFIYNNEAYSFIMAESLDSTIVSNLVKFGNVDFSKSKTDIDSCKIYLIENSYKERDLELMVKNCDSIATILDIKYANN
ncbi:hypothetical protein [Winogradskyella costae]|uniref:hypothetical protein n=1 Tax=Winogradskyella costae TaxID=2697008 RepID=UPI0015C79186|nr:hypothetical protein [Winogradskyella costae]